MEFIFYQVPDSFSKEKIEALIHEKLRKKFFSEMQAEEFKKWLSRNDIKIDFSSKSSNKKASLIVTPKELIESFGFYFKKSRDVITEIAIFLDGLIHQIFNSCQEGRIDSLGRVGEEIEIHFTAY